MVGEFRGPGLVVLVGVTHEDTPAVAARLADKVYDLRIFGPEHAGPDAADARSEAAVSARELSAADLDLPVLVVSQFTLYGDTRKGRRPSWNAAAPGPLSEPLVEAYVAALRQRGAKVETGRFGADMEVALVNEGPVTLILEVDS